MEGRGTGCEYGQRLSEPAVAASLRLNSCACFVTAVCSPREWGVESRNNRHHSHKEKYCPWLRPVSQKA
ncbi:hypothetical protein PAMP_004784 [Pampus punctatissimus]